MKYIVGLAFCIFMGILGISVGMGAAYPPINSIAQPLVCPNGEMVSQQTFSNPLPGRTYIRASWVCVEPSGNRTPIDSFMLSLYAGSFYGLVLFVLLTVVSRLRRGARPAGPYSR
jgi:hypothetical protein